jgi:cephalosporin hydroxylase
MSRTLYEIFQSNTGKQIHKWIYAFDVYERYLAAWKDKKVTLLEIGVQNGGSLCMWKEYLGANSTIIGVDILPACAQVAEPDQDIHVRIGNVADIKVLEDIVKEFGTIDIVIDDGDHFNPNIAAAFAFLYPKLSENGCYIIEDIGGVSSTIGPMSTYNNSCFDHIKETVKTVDTFSVSFYSAMMACERGLIDWSHRKTGHLTPVTK